VSGTQATWSWSPSADNVGVAGYQIFDGADWIGNVTGTSYTQPLPVKSTIRVRAYDAAGNKSAFASLPA
jgi:hypothetical protein